MRFVAIGPLLCAVATLCGCHLLFPFSSQSRPQDDAVSDQSSAADTAAEGLAVDAVQPPDSGRDGMTASDGVLVDAPAADAPLLPDLVVADLAPPPPDAPLLPDLVVADLAPPPPDTTPPLPDLTVADTAPPPPDAPPPDTTPPLPDLTVADTAPPPLDSAICLTTSAPIVINEMMIAPLDPDPTGEWFELHNAGNICVNLNGWQIYDKETSVHSSPLVIQTDLIVPPNGYVIIAADQHTLPKNLPNATETYTYANGSCTYAICLPNTEPDFLEVYDVAGTLVDKVSYDNKWSALIQKGQSLSLKSPGLDNALPANWCLETTIIQGDPKKNMGTPGAPTGC